jgi:hypothetical protein
MALGLGWYALKIWATVTIPTAGLFEAVERPIEIVIQRFEPPAVVPPPGFLSSLLLDT